MELPDLTLKSSIEVKQYLPEGTFIGDFTNDIEILSAKLSITSNLIEYTYTDTRSISWDERNEIEEKIIADKDKQ